MPCIYRGMTGFRTILPLVLTLFLAACGTRSGDTDEGIYATDQKEPAVNDW